MGNLICVFKKKSLAKSNKNFNVPISQKMIRNSFDANNQLDADEKNKLINEEDIIIFNDYEIQPKCCQIAEPKENTRLFSNDYICD